MMMSKQLAADHMLIILNNGQIPLVEMFTQPVKAIIATICIASLIEWVTEFFERFGTETENYY